jgi:hypothetical protein
MNVADFLPTYPDITDKNFYNSLLAKKEFNELELTPNETFPKERGMSTKYQKTIARYLSSHTPYDKFLIVHSMGLGKCVLPTTQIDLLTTKEQIVNLWKDNKTEIITDCDGGEWTKPLQELFVNSYDDKTCKMVSKNIIFLYRQHIDEIIRTIKTETKEISMTLRHKLLTDKGWNNKLKVGDNIAIYKNGSIVYEKIINIDSLKYTGFVYDLEVEKTHSYIANNIISHNTCSAIGAIEQIRDESNSFDGAIILARGEGLLSNFKNELVFKCTRGQYIPDNYNKLTSLEKTRRIQKKIGFYTLETFIKFAKHISRLKDDDIKKQYSNKIIVIDEVHNIKSDEEDDVDEKEELKDKDKKVMEKTINDASLPKDNNVEIDFLAELTLALEEKVPSIINRKRGFDVYNEIYRFLHTVTNCKIILLSGTPMKDAPNEIADVANLLLPKDQNFTTEDEFLKEYMIPIQEDRDKCELKGIDITKYLGKENKTQLRYEMRENKKRDFKDKLKGLISFLREPESTIEKKYLGQNNLGLRYLTIHARKMSTFQTEHYMRAYDRDKTEGSIYTNSREASLFVFPDGTWGSEGFKKYITEKILNINMDNKQIKKKKHVLSNKWENYFGTGSNTEKLEKLGKLSVLYKNTIKKILETKGNCFVYSSIVKGGGCILFSLILELFGFRRATGNETEKGLRYALLTGETTGKQKLVKRFNEPDNLHGEYIQVIIGSRAVSEGFSFNNMLYEAILTPHWNYSETTQAISRGIRLGSHNDLVRIDIKPIVEISQFAAIPDRTIATNKKYKSIDLYLYKLSEDKDVSIRSIMRLLMECAVDCGLNYIQNRSRGVKGSRECDYMDCNFKCDGISDVKVDDYTSYLNYYFNPKVSDLKKKVESLLRTEGSMTSERLSQVLVENGFGKEEVSVFLKDITVLNYDTFIEKYSQPPIVYLVNKIIELFQTRFRLDLLDIQAIIPDSRKEELIYALHYIISKNLPIKNKYGLNSYLREKNNSYFLVSNVDDNIDFFSYYYSQYPCAKTSITLKEITDSIQEQVVPNLVTKLFTFTTEKEVKETMKLIPSDIQELILETSIIAENNNSQSNPEVRALILDYFRSNIKITEFGYISDLIKDKPRYLDEKGDWLDCDDIMKEVLKNTMLKDQSDRQIIGMSGNAYIGKVNPKLEKDAFCIAVRDPDDREEKDTRKLKPGRKCTTIDVNQLRKHANDMNIPTKAGDTAADLCKKIREKFECEDKIIYDDQCAVREKTKK